LAGDGLIGRGDDLKLGKLMCRERDDLLLFGLDRGLQNKRHAQIFLEKVLARGEARGRGDVIDKVGNTKNHGFRRLFRANTRAGGYSAFAKGARQTQNACEAANALLLRRSESRERSPVS